MIFAKSVNPVGRDHNMNMTLNGNLVRRIVVLMEFGVWAELPSHTSKGSFSWLDLRNRIVCNVCLAVCTVS